jgi:hypothetical protein
MMSRPRQTIKMIFRAMSLFTRCGNVQRLSSPFTTCAVIHLPATAHSSLRFSSISSHPSFAAHNHEPFFFFVSALG